MTGNAIHFSNSLRFTSILDGKQHGSRGSQVGWTSPSAMFVALSSRAMIARLWKNHLYPETRACQFRTLGRMLRGRRLWGRTLWRCSGDYWAFNFVDFFSKMMELTMSAMAADLALGTFLGLTAWRCRCLKSHGLMVFKIIGVLRVHY